MLELYVAPQLEEFQPWIIFQQDGAPPHRGSHVRRFLDATFPNRWTGRGGPTTWPPRSPVITPLWLLFMRVCYGQSVFDTSSRYYKFEGKNNRRFCYNNWRHVGEHVERNWLSIRRSPCNKRNTCWSVLMCCKKKLLELHFEKKKCLYSTYSSFIVINVCNQGKTLCSPCRI